jgi:hypothetical protein
MSGSYVKYDRVSATIPLAHSQNLTMTVNNSGFQIKYRGLQKYMLELLA